MAERHSPSHMKSGQTSKANVLLANQNPNDFINSSKAYAIGDGQKRLPFEMTATKMLNTGSQFMMSEDNDQYSHQ